MADAGEGKGDFFKTTWTDLRIVPGVFDFSRPTAPQLATWQPGGSGSTFEIYEFDTGDEAYFTIQMPHTYVQGTDLYPHVHWTPRDRGVSESGNTVNWCLDYTICNVNCTYSPSATVSFLAICDGVNDKHQVKGNGPISGTGLHISHILVGRIYRGSGDTWATNTPGNLPSLLEIDFHYQLDTTGSQQEFIKTDKNV
jgi:hypothetical protein